MSTKIWTVIGMIIGVLINHFIIKPIEQKYYRKNCIKEGLTKESDTDAEEFKK